MIGNSELKFDFFSGKNDKFVQCIQYRRSLQRQPIFSGNVGLLIKYSSQKFFFGKIQPFLDIENDFETQNFEIFDQVCS